MPLPQERMIALLEIADERIRQAKRIQSFILSLPITAQISELNQLRMHTLDEAGHNIIDNAIALINNFASLPEMFSISQIELETLAEERAHFKLHARANDRQRSYQRFKRQRQRDEAGRTEVYFADTLAPVPIAAQEPYIPLRLRPDYTPELASTLPTLAPDVAPAALVAQPTPQPTHGAHLRKPREEPSADIVRRHLPTLAELNTPPSGDLF
jgi:hypothetical protein